MTARCVLSPPAAVQIGASLSVICICLCVAYCVAAQHGPEECYLNRVEACGLSMISEGRVDLYVHLTLCPSKGTYTHTARLSLQSLGAFPRVLCRCIACKRRPHALGGGGGSPVSVLLSVPFGCMLSSCYA